MAENKQDFINTSIIEELIKSINTLQFGSIEITVHDGRVTQIEKREKLRFQSADQKQIPTVRKSA